MPGPNLRIIGSVAELRAEGERWDRLWQASDATSGLSQAELLALEFEQFCPNTRLQIIVVEQDGAFIAGLPLVERRRARLWGLGSLSGNCWSPTADLLVDPAADVEGALELLVAGLAETGWPIVDLHAFDPRLDRWGQFRHALETRGVRHLGRERFPVPLVRIEQDWSTYVASLSRNHRRQMRRKEKSAERSGGVELRVLRDIAPAELEDWMLRGFGVEDRNWKGVSGGSVLKSPGMFDFLLRQAQALAAKGQLHLTFLERQGTPIAFEYGWASKGVYFAFKIGYDEAFAELSPSQLLRWRLFERFFTEPGWRMVDFAGPMTRATASWSNDQYLLNRMLIAPRRLSGRLALVAYERLLPLLKRRATRTASVELEAPSSAEHEEDLCAAEL